MIISDDEKGKTFAVGKSELYFPGYILKAGKSCYSVGS